jgi:hypothetical protein
MTAPTVLTPDTKAWGEMMLPLVESFKAVEPSPPMKSFKYLPESEASGVITKRA